MKSISTRPSNGVKYAIFSAALAGVLGFAGSASAQQACGDSSCPKGYSCETVPAVCPTIDCAEGQPCTPCPTGTVQQCVAEACDSDADCDEHMICLTREVATCSGQAAPACPPGAACDVPAPEPPDCTLESYSQCVPRWTLGCATAADCGEGFACIEQESCGCSGSSGGGTPSSGGSTPPSSGGGSDPKSEPAPLPDPPPAAGSGGSAGFAPQPTPDPSLPAPPGAPVPPDARPPAGPDCGCLASAVKTCSVIERACASDADCPSDWSCSDNPEGVCWASSDGKTGCEPGDPPKVCLPPYRDLGGGVGFAEDGAETPGNGTASPTNPEPGSTPPTATPVPANAPGNAEADDDRRASSEGCSMSTLPNRAANGVGLAAFAAALVLSLRRSRSRIGTNARRSPSR